MKKNLFIVSLLGFTRLFAQTQDSISAIQLESVQLVEKLPITIEKITKKNIDKKNFGQQIPSLLNNSTSVITTFDDGMGLGHGSVRIRGLSESQINVTMNGIQLNDGESQGVFWVNLPDMASSANSIVIQRGVGSSSNGMSAFGASINIDNQNPSNVPFLDLNTSFGSYGSQRYTVQAGTGKILNNKLKVDGRFSKITSNGYVDRAWTDLLSYDITALYAMNKNTSFRFENMFGRQETYQAWNGLTSDQIKENRRFNTAGAIYNASWDQIIDFYDKEVDNYRQNHYQLAWNQNYGNNWKSTLTAHYTKGKGFYENYSQDAKLAKYKLGHLGKTSDLVRQKFLNNNFYGFNLELDNKKLGDFEFYFGLSGNQYDGDHYGIVNWIKDYNLVDTSSKYYNNNALKTQISTYAKLLYKVNSFEFYGDLQYRYVDYKGKYNPQGENVNDDFRPFNDYFNFFNPKTGLNYKLSSNQNIYASYGISQREPLRVDYLNNSNEPKSEFLQDFEIGYKINGNLSFSSNLYYMRYKNQLVQTGEINDVGTPIRKNIDKSYRAGLEVDANYKLHSKFSIFGNLNLSKNENIDYLLKNNDGKEVVEDTKPSYSPEFISSFGFNFEAVKSVNISMVNKYVSSQNLTNDGEVKGTIDSYFVSDVMLNYAPKIKKIKRLEFSLSLNNIFNKEYITYGYYDAKYTQTQYYFPQAKFNVLGGVKIML